LPALREYAGEAWRPHYRGPVDVQQQGFFQDWARAKTTSIRHRWASRLTVSPQRRKDRVKGPTHARNHDDHKMPKQMRRIRIIRMMHGNPQGWFSHGAPPTDNRTSPTIQVTASLSASYGDPKSQRHQETEQDRKRHRKLDVVCTQLVADRDKCTARRKMLKVRNMN
jgi:hypothetical protein